VSKSASRIFLVGPMGAGKTTIGKKLARALHLRFVDCDHEIEHRTGATIPLIFDVEGEAGFRAREKRVIEDLVQEDDIVVATGGGAVLDPENRAALHASGYVVYLHAPLEHLLARTRGDTNRPLLKAGDRVKKMQEILTAREPLYREVADLIVDTGALTLTAVVQNIRTSLP
jgi:shikimate kinase